MSTQVAIRLPDDLVGELDWLVGRCDYSSRSEAMRFAINALVRVERSREIDEQYVAAYTKHPQTEEELAGLDHQSFADLDDDEDWSWLWSTVS
ncbi:MAG: ribbon-helix-helix domain-containing protein [Actinomycetia bacterium]|nr:ribbon-helix-helix domain-containing protein [Actinomycetes bacterium]